MPQDTICCGTCSAELSRPLERSPVVPERRYADHERVSLLPTAPPGTWFVDPEPRARTGSGEPVGAVGCLVLNPGDAICLVAHPDGIRSAGCCGHDGCSGPNRLCSACRAEVATLSDDCWTVVELRFEPAAVVVRTR